MAGTLKAIICNPDKNKMLDFIRYLYSIQNPPVEIVGFWLYYDKTNEQGKVDAVTNLVLKLKSRSSSCDYLLPRWTVQVDIKETGSYIIINGYSIECLFTSVYNSDSEKNLRNNCSVLEADCVINCVGNFKQINDDTVISAFKKYISLAREPSANNCWPIGVSTSIPATGTKKFVIQPNTDLLGLLATIINNKYAIERCQLQYRLAANSGNAISLCNEILDIPRFNAPELNGKIVASAITNAKRADTIDAIVLNANVYNSSLLDISHIYESFLDLFSRLGPLADTGLSPDSGEGKPSTLEKEKIYLDTRAAHISINPSGAHYIYGLIWYYNYNYVQLALAIAAIKIIYARYF